MQKTFGIRSFVVFGEESLRDTAIELSDDHKLVALLDMVDGTDLLARGLSNWCSAMILYRAGRILGSFVGIPGEGVYYATDGVKGAFKKPVGTAPAERVRGPRTDRDLSNANISFYGQKAKNYLAVAENEGWLRAVRTVRSDGSALRIYNLGGNPMMMRLIDGNEQIDAVFDIQGQLPHDAVPGAYIAQRAGAILYDLEKKPISEDRLAELLRRPANPRSRLKYVLAGSEKLAAELVDVLGKRA